jgi:collagenase-like PrtC family protease
MNKIELLAPARDAQAAITAIQCGADAVYIGAPHFGARQAASNSLDDIRRVVEYAHPYYVKVYVTLNTLLKDEELSVAQTLIHQIYGIGIDGLIIQDTGLLELDLPPIPLIASTQMNNDSADKVKFLEEVGFSRVILARELTLEQIREIRRQTSIELECFIHGALCVGASGQCYMSYAIGGRSGNRGVCAQPCRRLYTLKDKDGNVIVKDRYLLSLKDLNLSEHLEELVDAGITAFKIEGRLKEASYVANIVGFYRQKLDAILAQKKLAKSSSGEVTLNFTPNPDKTFNRGYTDYGITGRGKDIGSMDTPKAVGECVGVAASVEKTCFTLDGDIQLHNGDGICFFDTRNNLVGTAVNGVESRRIRPQKMDDIRAGLKIYRNYDHEFTKLLEKNPAQRKISISLVLRDTAEGVALLAKDCDENEAAVEINMEKKIAQKKDAATETIQTQLKKLGNTIFQAADVNIETEQIYFFPVSMLNQLRRETIGKLLEVRQTNRSQKECRRVPNEIPYPQRHLDFRGNVLNGKARGFYLRHGADSIEPAAETGLDLTGNVVMTTKYCLRRQLGLCQGREQEAESMILEDEDGRQFEVKFHCGICGMTLIPQNTA